MSKILLGPLSFFFLNQVRETKGPEATVDEVGEGRSAPSCSQTLRAQSGVPEVPKSALLGLHWEGGGYKAIFPAVGRWLNLRQLSLVSTEKEREPPPAATPVWTPADLTGVGKSCSGNTGHGYSIQPG